MSARRPNGEGALGGTVAGPQPGQGATIEIARPNVRAIEGEISRTVADREASDEIGSVERLSGCGRNETASDGKKDGGEKPQSDPDSSHDLVLTGSDVDLSIFE